MNVEGNARGKKKAVHITMSCMAWFWKNDWDDKKKRTDGQMDRHMHRKASERWAAFSLMGKTNYETWKLSMFLANIQIEEKVYCIDGTRRQVLVMRSL